MLLPPYLLSPEFVEEPEQQIHHEGTKDTKKAHEEERKLRLPEVDLRVSSFLFVIFVPSWFVIALFSGLNGAQSA